MLEKKQDCAMLDAGCWDGQNSVKYATAIGTQDVHGLELVEDAVKKAITRSVKAKKADLNEKLPYPDNTFDAIISNHVIEHLYKPHIFAKELYRILKPGGYLVIGTPNLSSWHNVAALVIGRQPFSGPTVQMGVDDNLSKFRQEKINRLTENISSSQEGNDAYGHIVVLTYKTLIRLLKSVGFKIEIAKGYGYHPFPPFIAKKLANIDKNHSHYILIKVRK